MRYVLWFLMSGIIACLVIRVLAWLVTPALPMLVVLSALFLVYAVVLGGPRRL